MLLHWKNTILKELKDSWQIMDELLHPQVLEEFSIQLERLCLGALLK
jgi:hypothetical protein